MFKSRYIQEGKDKHIEQKEAEIKKSEERAFDINEEKAEFESEIDKMKDDFSKQEVSSHCSLNVLY